MNLRQSILTLILFASSAMTLMGQCDVTLGAPILDNSTGSIEILIDGAINNDLSAADQGLCGVELYFNHESIRDISIRLESPSGQSIILVGPSTGAGGPTDFTYWGLEFVPCDSTAMPDLPILGDVFTTEDNWGIFGNYNGQYYPQQGCLEDYDAGPVNGIWTLSFTDVFSFDEGAIDSIKLTFCDSTNVYCQECFASGGTLPAINSDYCESDPALNLEVEPVFEMEPPVDLYHYNYLIVEEGEVIGAIEDPNLTSYNFGTYQVCGISSLIGQTEDILDDVIGTDYNDLLDLFDDSDYCAALSTNCIPINIIEVPDTILTVDTICLGEVLTLDGNQYTETGEYVISFSQSFCDSVSILNLFVIDNQASIIADSDTISCLDGDVVLDASGSIVSPSTTLNWFKVNDVIDPSIAGNEIITVTEAGVYGLSAITGNCADTAYHEIFNDESIPSFTFNVDTLSCNDPAVLIDMTPSIELQSLQWTGPLSASIEDIFVATSGTYYIEGVALNGCLGRDSVFVVEDLDVPVPIFEGDTLTCAIDTATIIAILPDSISFAYVWDGPNIVEGFGFGDTVQVMQDTTYILRLQNLENGCIEQYEYDVLIDTVRTNFTIQSTIIDCDTPESIITVNPAIDTIDYKWANQDQGFVGIGDTISVAEEGMYQLVTTTSNGCIDTFSHIVVKDTLAPVVNVDDVIISCLMDSVQLVTTTLETDLTYYWSGPGDFESTEMSPFVSNPGTYILEATNSFGCMVRIMANVYAGAGLPDLIFDLSDTLDCNVDVITITPNDTTNLRFEWLSDGIVDTTAHIVDVEFSGAYTLIITDTISGCNLLYEVMVPDDFEEPIPEVEVATIDCNTPMVTLNTTFEMAVDSLRWTSEVGFTSTDQSPNITEGGEYYITAVGFNGCIFTDTITVIDDTGLPILSTDVPLLDCISSSVDISFMTDDDTDSLSIRLPNGDLVGVNTLTVLMPDTYMAIATSLSGCVDSMEMVVLQDLTPPVASLLTDGQIDCIETTTTILVDDNEEGLTYEWTGASIISPLGVDSVIVDAAGMYNVVVTDTANCTTDLTINVESFIDFPIVSATVDTINCTTSMATIALDVPANTISITWEGPSEIDQDITNFSTAINGTYTATVTADNNCETEQNIVVVMDTIKPVIEVMSNGILDCDTEMITLTSTSNISGSTFEWTDPNNSILTGASVDVGAAGNYDLAVMAPNTCITDTFIVVEADTLRPEIITGEDHIFSCADGKLFLTIETTTNITSYAWEGPFSFESDIEAPLAIAPGIYTVTVTNDLGCFTSAEISVIDDTQGPEIMVRDTFVTCDELAVPLPLETNDTEVSFTWDAIDFSSELQNPETNVVGQYIVYAISDRNECVTVDTVDVSFVEVLPVFEIESSNINCYQSQTILKALDVEDDISAIWTDDNFNALSEDTLLVEMADSFYLLVMGNNTCIDTVKVVVEEDFYEADLEIQLNEPFQCDNTEVTLEGVLVNADNMDDFSVNWSSSNGTIISDDQSFNANISGEGTYVLTILNSVNGCESVDSIELIKEAQSLLGISIEGEDPNCLGLYDGSISVVNVEGGFGPYEYIFNNGTPQQEPMISNLGAGEYTIEVVDSIGCSIDMDFELFDGLDLIVLAESDTLIIVGDTINLNSIFNIPDEEIASISWSAHNSDYSCDDCFEAPVTPLINTYYTLSATSIDGCEGSSEVLVRVNRNPIIEVANVFAPGSENNGLFYIQQTQGIEKVLSMSVFDKWASRMFWVTNVFPADPSAGWDGTYKGQYVNPGVYVVVVELLLRSGEVVTYAGDITVLR